MKPVKSQKPARNRGKWGAGSGSVIDWETNSIMTYRERLYCWAFAKRAVGIRSSIAESAMDNYCPVSQSVRCRGSLSVSAAKHAQCAN